MRFISSGTASGAVMALAACALLPDAVLAEDHEERWRLGVFGTLGALYHDEDGASYRRSLQPPRGSTAGKLDLGQDSVLGAQINGRANDHVEGMLQAVSRWRADNSWCPAITWGYLRLTTDETLVLRLGRVGVDSQFNAESRLIGFASLPIRPAHDLHASITPDYFDGGDLKLSHPLGSGIATAKLFYGTTDTEIHAAGAADKLPKTLSRGLILGFTTDPWTARLYGGVATLRTLGATQPLVDILRAIPAPQHQAAADALDMRGTRLSFFGADVGYESGPLSLQASLLKQVGERAKLLVPDALSTAYLAGYRFGRFTPYLQYSRMHKQAPAYTPGLGPALDGAIQTVVDSSQQYQRTRGVGVRIDIARNFAFKLQIDRVTARHSPLILDASRTASDDAELTLYAAALDFAY